MKKIFILFLLGFMVINVHAETFYTNFKILDNDSKKCKDDFDNELCKKESKVVYNNYHEVIDKEGYYPLGENPSNLTYLDESDYIDDYVYDKDAHVSKENIYHTVKVEDIPFGVISLKPINSNAYLFDYNFYYKDESIRRLTIKSTYSSSTKFTSNQNLVLGLLKGSTLKDFSIYFNFGKSDDSPISMEFFTYESMNDYNNNNPNNHFEVLLDEGRSAYYYKVNFTDNNSFTKLVNDIDFIENKDINEVSYYPKEAIKYRYYSLKREYLNEYTEDPISNYILDLNDSKTIYDYYARDYITVPDEIDDINSIYLDSSIPLDLITTDYNDKTKILTIKYQDNIFYKKININKKEIDNKIINSEEEIKIVNDLSNNIQEKDSLIFKSNRISKVKSLNNNLFANDVHNEDSPITNNLNNKINDELKNQTTDIVRIEKDIYHEKKNNNHYYIILTFFIFIIIFAIIMCKYLTTIHKDKI